MIIKILSVLGSVRPLSFLFAAHPYSLDELLSGSSETDNITLVLVSLHCLPVRSIVFKMLLFVLKVLHGPSYRFISERLCSRDVSESVLTVVFSCVKLI